jgi:peptide/nickel transport system substrate-binding protein
MNTVMAHSGLLKFKSGRDIRPGTYTPIGDLAESWEQPDNLTYSFKLRRGVKFHNIAPVNGREATSADIVYSYQRAIDLKFLASLLGGVQRMETPDPYTFKITLAEPNADFLVNLAATNLAVVAKEAVDVNGDLKNGPHIGTGPWIVSSVAPGTRDLVLTRNPDYYVKGVPYVDRVEISHVFEPSTLIAAFRAGQLDAIGGGVSPQQVEPIFKASPAQFTFEQIPLYLAQDELGFKVDAPPFNDPRIRKAVVLAMDREALIATANGGFGILTSGVVTPDATWQLSPDTLKPLYKSDVEGAKRLLAEAGQPNLQFELTVPTYKSQVYVTMGEQLQAQLRAAGIEVKLKPLDATSYGPVVQQRGEFSAYLGNNGTRLSANQDLLGRYHGKGALTKIQTRYNNPKLDDLIDQQKVLSADPAKRRTLLEQIQRTVIDDNVIVSVSAPIQGLLRWSYVKDFYVNGSITDSLGCWIRAWIDK